VNKETGVSVEQLGKLADLLKQHSPSLVIVGGAAEGYAHGSQIAAAVALLNRVLGNVGKTIEAPMHVPFPQIEPTVGTRAALQALNDSVANGKVKVLFNFGVNPVFTAPSAFKFKENLNKVPFKVAFAHYLDETALQADLVLPLDSALEDWGTSVPEYLADDAQLNIHQPLMEKLHPETRGVGDILLSLIKQRRANEYKDYEDFYSYLRNAVVKNKSALGGNGSDDDTFWAETLSKGLVKFPAAHGSLTTRAGAVKLSASPEADSGFPLQLIPYVTPNQRDGRNANQPWLQESPDPLTTIVWDSWVEIHPQTAAKLGIVEGDIVEVTSRNGSIKTQAYLFPGIHPDAISIPLGYGHEAMGRYAKGIGANVFGLLDPVMEQETGELALNETRVKISKVGKRVIVIKDEGAVGGKQMGKKIAVRLSTDVVDLSGEV
jgi:molybdopterin-containing oxidoreductase family iron-sulfur binding subunit